MGKEKEEEKKEETHLACFKKAADIKSTSSEPFDSFRPGFEDVAFLGTQTQ